MKNGKKNKMGFKIMHLIWCLDLSLYGLVAVRSLGLAVAPRVRFLNKAQQQKSGVATDNSGAAGHESEDELKSFKAQLKGEQSHSQSSQSEDDDDDEEEETLKPAALLCGFDEEDEDDQKDQDLLTVKRKDVFNINEESQDDEVNKHTSGVITVIAHFWWAVLCEHRNY